MQPFHEGERSAQARAGTRDVASRVGAGIRSFLPEAARGFLEERSFVILAAIDSGGRAWTSILRGRPGFLRARGDRVIEVRALPPAGDPLAATLASGGPLGILAIDFETRRRMRVNGRAEPAEGGVLSVHVDEAYSNCPKYIREREEPRAAGRIDAAEPPRVATALSAEQRRWIDGSDTFFVGSRHPAAGADASHRGGEP